MTGPEQTLTVASPLAVAVAHREAGPDGPALTRYPAGRHRFALLTVAATLFLVFAGGLVTSTGSGLSVPDWPLSYGMLMPPMVGGIFYEHGHRMVATAVGLLTLILAIWTSLREPRRWLRRWAWIALSAVVAQGLLGGLTVIFLLPTAISVSHACLAQTFLCILVGLAYATSREWLTRAGAARPAAALIRPALAATAVVYLQLMLGAVMRHSDAGLAIPDFPLAFGRLIPPLDDPRVAIHFAHRLGALAVLGFTVALFAATRRAGEPKLGRLAGAVLALVLVQLALGATAIWTGRSVLPTTLHVAAGAAILGSCWLITMRAWRLSTPDPGPAESTA